MSRKRKDVYPLEISNNGRPRICVDKNDIVELTKLVRSWDFTCSFCFKKFPSAQAMGGHQNAHRSQRSEERRLFVRDPIGHRKRLYLRERAGRKSAIEIPPNPALNLHAATMMMKRELANINLGPPKIPTNQLLPVGGSGEFNDGNNSFSNPTNTTTKDSPVVINIKNNNGSGTANLKNHQRPSTSASAGVMNYFLAPKELSLVESVGRVNAADAKGKAVCMEFDVGGYDEMTMLDQKLDLTLRL